MKRILLFLAAAAAAQAVNTPSGQVPYNPNTGAVTATLSSINGMSLGSTGNSLTFAGGSSATDLSGQLTLAAGGTNQNVALTPSGTGVLAVGGQIVGSTSMGFGTALGSTGYKLYSNTADGMVIGGYGTTSDVSLVNRAGAAALTVPANTVDAVFSGNLTISGTGTSSFAGPMQSNAPGIGVGTGGIGVSVSSGQSASINLNQSGVQQWAIYNKATTGALAFQNGGADLITIAPTSGAVSLTGTLSATSGATFSNDVTFARTSGSTWTLQCPVTDGRLVGGTANAPFLIIPNGTGGLGIGGTSAGASQVNVNFSTASTSTSTGALVINNNVGLGGDGNVWIAGALHTAGSAASSFAGPVHTTSTSTAAALNIGSYAGDPGAVANGDLWYNSSTNALRARIGGSSVSLGGGGGSAYPPPEVQAAQAAGSGLQAMTAGLSISAAVTSTSLSSGRLYWVAVWLPNAATLHGVAWYQSTAGNYTNSGTDYVGLYSYSGGTMTLVASSAGTTGAFVGTSNAYNSLVFSSAYSAAAGLYFVALLYQETAQTTPPALACSANIGSAVVLHMYGTSSGFTLSGYVTGQTSLPSSETISTLALPTTLIWAGVY